MNFRNLLVQLGLVAGNAAAKWDPSGIASLLLDAYGKKREKDHLRAELEALMRADFQQFRAQLQDAMGELRLQLAESVRAQVEAYLSQFQASARQAARHLGDPSATTVPATVGVDDPKQLAAFLPQRPPQFTVGSVVPGLPSWTLIEPLGVGGFGEVWKARHEDDGIVAAFKFFLDPTARSRFTAAEAKVLKEIHQKAPTDGVVKLIQAEARQDPPWIQFEFIPGGDLARLPESWAKLPAAERVARAQSVIRSLATTVGHFHNLGVVHRDLKPSNVLLRENGSLVVADFGISRILPSGAGTAPTPTNSALATIRAYTPAYASPQQKKFLPADRRDDVYALAVLWYQLLRGDFSLESPRGDGWKDVLARMGVSEDVVKLLNRSWDDDPDVRPKDGNEFAEKLGAERSVVRQVVAKPLPRQASPTESARLERRPATPPPCPPERRPSRPKETDPLPARLKPVESHRGWIVGGVVGGIVILSVIGYFGPKSGWPPPETPAVKEVPPAGESTRSPAPSGRLVTDPRDPNLKPGDVYVLKIGNPAVDMRFRWCPPGWFMMGGKATFDNAEPIHKVTLTKGFWLGETEVTQAQWQAVMKDNPNPSKFKGDDLPAENVTALDADAFAEAIKRATGKPIRLPFEAEWEYACRAGTSTDYHTGNGEDALKRAGWYEGNSGSTTHPVGKLAPNPWGLFDMHGNVWEWCIDEYRPYKAGDQIDPFVQSNNNTRSYRGGSWGDSPACCLAAHRFWSESGGRCSYLGLRVCVRQD